jgi:hypothetical protein
VSAREVISIPDLSLLNGAGLNLPNLLLSYSGVSWARNAGKKDVRVITDWPKPGYHNSNAEKVPSCISYKDGRPDKFGYLVGHSDTSPQGFKLLLDPSGQHSEEVKLVGNNIPFDFRKPPIEVATDYLRWIWKYALEDIARIEPRSVKNDSELKVVLTVPAIWNEQAKDQILQAARKAEMPPNIKLVREPEAAALAVLREKAELGDLKVCEQQCSHEPAPHNHLSDRRLLRYL